MSYKQSWGISRLQSPLNDNGSRTIMEEPKSLTDDSGNVIETVDYDKDIVKQNNENAVIQTASTSGSSFFTKQALKEGVKKYVGPAIGKVAGVMGMFLTSQSAQARPAGEIVDGEYIKYSDFDNPKWSETSHGKRYKDK